MTKTSLILLAVSFLLLSGLHARTWTSADGTKTFEGTLRSYAKETGIVTVIVNGRPLSFEKSMLSEEDIKFLDEEMAAQVNPAEEAAKTVVGAKVTGTKLHRIDGKRFKNAELDKAPDYYILYYSASW